MSKLSVAEASASKSGIYTTLDLNTTTQPDANNSRGPELQGNTYPKKHLSQEEKDTLIKAAIQKTISSPVLEWGNIDLYSLLSYGSMNYVGSTTARRFFMELLLFVARPEIANEFGGAVPDGLEIIGKLSKFFNDLHENDHQREFLDYSDIEWGVEDDAYQRIAKRYLTGTELEMVLSEEKPEPKAPAYITPWYLRAELEEPPFTLTDEQLVEALDRYYPHHQWPVDKKIIAANDRMKANLVAREKERLSILTETPEQKEKRLAADAVYKAIIGPPIPTQLDAIAEAVDALKSPKVLGPDTQLLFQLSDIKHQPLVWTDEQKAAFEATKAAQQPIPKKTPAKKPTSKPTTTKKKA